jgi:hypothetical protein
MPDHETNAAEPEAPEGVAEIEAEAKQKRGRKKAARVIARSRVKVNGRIYEPGEEVPIAPAEAEGEPHFELEP